MTTTTNTLFVKAIELQIDVAKKSKAVKSAKTKHDAAAFVQMVLFITGNQSEKIKPGTKKAGSFQANLIDNHAFPKRHAQTISSISLNKNIFDLISKGLAGLDEPTDDIHLAQQVTELLVCENLETINKLKAYIATPTNKVQKLLEAIAKLEQGQLEDFQAGYDAYLEAIQSTE
jgi:hypothetical protein